MKLPHIVILAAGQGSRFWPMTTPKEQYVFLGKPLLVHNVESLAKAGFKNIVIVGNPHDKEFVQSLVIPGLVITFVVLPKPTGMADALKVAGSVVGDNPMIVMNADDVVEESLYATLVKESAKATSFVVGHVVKEYFDGGYLVEKNGLATSIVEKPGADRAPSDIINLVYHYFPDASKFIEIVTQTKSAHDDVYEKALATYFSKEKVRIVRYSGLWSPLKYPWHVLDIMNILFTKLTPHKGKNLQVKANVVIEGNVWIGDNVKIFENTKIIGPCFIGDNCIIGNNSMIRESHLGAGGIMGFTTDITRSFMGENCWFHHNYVGDSVLEGNISMGSGATLANLRLDEQAISSVVKGVKVPTHKLRLGALIGRDVRIGVNTSIMPGVKIGTRTFVGSGLTIDQDVPDNSFCVGIEGSYTVRKNTRSINPDARESFRKAL